VNKQAVRRLVLVCVLALAGSVLGGYFRMQKEESAVPPGATATLQQIELPDVDKNLRSGNEWLGKVVIVNHWATWCAPCREEIPMLIEYRHQTMDKGVEVVGIAHDQLDSTRIFGDEIGIDYPSLVAIVGGTELMVSQGNPSGGALPFTVVFDRQGKLVRTKLGKISLEELHATVDPLL
jgi:thiol-disulfide isomerase/thioredoxin